MAELQDIFDGQKELMAKYHNIERDNGCVVVKDHGNLDNRFVQMRLKDLSQRMIEELMESTNELKNRPWKRSDTSTNVTAFREEISDVLHFFVEFCITSGLDADDLYQLYFDKHAKNQARQHGSY